MAETEDKFVTLVNPQGEKEEVWDFADHVERMLSMGFTRPELPKKGQPITTNKEIL